MGGDPQSLSGCASAREAYALGLFLLAWDGQHGAFRYTDPTYARLVDFPNLHAAYGTPLGARYTWTDAWGVADHAYDRAAPGVYRRAYTGGTVTVNTQTHAMTWTALMCGA